MMEFVSCDDIGESPDTHEVVVRFTSPGEVFAGEVQKEAQGRFPYDAKFVEKVVEGTQCESPRVNEDILIESREPGPGVSREPEGSKCHDPFNVAHMAHDLFDAPFPGGIRKIRPGIRERGKQREGLMLL